MPDFVTRNTGEYIQELCEAHVRELEKNGLLAKGKG
jgi:hypothetical protein